MASTVVSIEFSPLSTVELTTSWYHLHNGDYQIINVFVQLSFLFSSFCSVSDGKSCFGIKKIDFDH